MMMRSHDEIAWRSLLRRRHFLRGRSRDRRRRWPHRTGRRLAAAAALAINDAVPSLWLLGNMLGDFHLRGGA